MSELLQYIFLRFPPDALLLISPKGKGNSIAVTSSLGWDLNAGLQVCSKVFCNHYSDYTMEALLEGTPAMAS